MAAGVFDHGGALRGYGVIRRCVSDWKIGPIFADSTPAAEALIFALATAASAATVIVDIPDPNREAVLLAQRLGLEPAFETARMYRGEVPALPLECVYGVTTLELG